MIKILRLYSSPDFFDPIEFDDGINLILGEKVDQKKSSSRKDKKTNGVGKSMSIEFLNFALLKKEDDSRVMKIPLDKIPKDLVVKVDISINDRLVTIERRYSEPDKPLIETGGEITNFNSCVDALVYLKDLLGEDKEEWSPSFRQLIAPLIRDEDSEFKNIIECFNLEQKIPSNSLVGTHLFFFDINPAPLEKIKNIFKKLTADKKTRSYIKNRLTENGQKKMSDIRSELNALEREIEKAEIALDNFESEKLLTDHRIELEKIEKKISDLQVKQSALRDEIRKIDSMPKPESLNVGDLEIVYNKFRDGLGDVVSKSLKDAISFKKKIESYQRDLIDDKLKTLRKELQENLLKLNDLDQKRASFMSLVDRDGILSDFKNSFAIYDRKKAELAKSISNLDEFEITDRNIKSLELKKDNLFSEIDAEIFEANQRIKSFQKLLVSMHEYIMGSAEASFDIETVNKGKSKEIARINFRIEDDGSRSVNRTKVFMYDIALMLNEFTREKHPRFLIHDNIFDVDQDTLVQCLNYLAEREGEGHEFQYILTLNRDKIEAEERKNKINLNIESHKRASFDRQNTFLKFKYKEI